MCSLADLGVNTHELEDLEYSRIDNFTSVRDDTDDNLLPALWSPRLGPSSGTQVGDVLDCRVEGSEEERVVFVVHCHDDLGLSVGTIITW